MGFCLRVYKHVEFFLCGYPRQFILSFTNREVYRNEHFVSLLAMPLTPRAYPIQDKRTRTLAWSGEPVSPIHMTGEILQSFPQKVIHYAGWCVSSLPHYFCMFVLEICLLQIDTQVYIIYLWILKIHLLFSISCTKCIRGSLMHLWYYLVTYKYVFIYNVKWYLGEWLWYSNSSSILESSFNNFGHTSLIQSCELERCGGKWTWLILGDYIKAFSWRDLGKPRKHKLKQRVLGLIFEQI